MCKPFICDKIKILFFIDSTLWTLIHLRATTIYLTQRNLATFLFLLILEMFVRGQKISGRKKINSVFLKKLRKEGLLIRFELDDSPWSQTRKVIYLPLGPHVSHADIMWIIDTVTKTI